MNENTIFHKLRFRMCLYKRQIKSRNKIKPPNTFFLTMLFNLQPFIFFYLLKFNNVIVSQYQVILLRFIKIRMQVLVITCKLINYQKKRPVIINNSWNQNHPQIPSAIMKTCVRLIYKLLIMACANIQSNECTSATNKVYIFSSLNQHSFTVISQNLQTSSMHIGHLHSEV